MHDREFLREVRRRRAIVSELEVKLGNERDWLEQNDERIEDTESEVTRLNEYRRSLRAADIELQMLLRGVAVQALNPFVTPLPKRLLPLSMPPGPTPQPMTASDINLSAEPSDAVDETAATTPEMKALEAPVRAVERALVRRRRKTPPPSDLVDTEPEMPAVVAPPPPREEGRRALFIGLVVGLVVVAWVVGLTRDAAPPLTEGGRRAPVGTQPRAPAYDPVRGPAVAPEPKKAAELAPVGPPLISLEPTAPTPPAPLPEPPLGMTLVRGGTLHTSLGPNQRAVAVAQCREDYARRSVLRAACEDALEVDSASSAPVEVSSFYIDRLEVSQRRYNQCRNVLKCPTLRLRWAMISQPATGVTVDMAKTYCAFRNGRLPTEHEWMYAARGDDERLYPWGDAPPVVNDLHKANYGRMGTRRPIAAREDGHKYAGPVGIFGVRVPGHFGAANLAGNVREWTSTKVGGRYVVKGGGWRDLGHDLRVTRRLVMKRGTVSNDLGFRCVRDLPTPE